MKLSLEYIQQLASGNESVDVEFKETTGQLSRGMETLCGMINGCGGIVVFGVSNKGKIIGQEVGDKTTREIGEALDRFDPATDIQPHYIQLKDSDRYLIVFQADGLDPDKPLLWDGKPYMRHDSVTSVMPREKFIKLHEQQHGLRYKWESDLNPDMDSGNLDEQLISDVIRSAVRRGRLSDAALNDSVQTALKRLGLVKDGALCNSAAVLFGKDFTDYPQCRLRLARFRGADRRDFIDNQQYDGNIFQLIEAAMAYFFKHLNLSGTTRHRIVREDELEIPYDALRESIVNAYCHMNWGYESASVGIAIYDDRIEIENAGRFPAAISPADLMQEEDAGLTNTSLPPNPVIANVMYLGGLVEHWGRGLSMMAKECMRVGLPAPKFFSNGSIVKITFARPAERIRSMLQAQPEFTKSTVEAQPDNYGHAMIRLVQAIGEDWYTSYDLRESMSFKSKTTFRQNYLNPAIKLGLIRLENPGNRNSPTQRYGLTVKGKAVYYSLAKTNVPVGDSCHTRRQSAFEGHGDPQNSDGDPQKTVIFNAIRQNGRISRKELADIAGCSESTVKRRLKEWNIAWIGHPKTGHWALIRDI